MSDPVLESQSVGLDGRPVFSHWRMLPLDDKVVHQLMVETGYPALVCRLLVLRGIKGREEAIAFFNPGNVPLHPPNLLSGMDKALARLLLARIRSEAVLLYGDFDVDGVTGVALLHAYFSGVAGMSVASYIPDRVGEGYGVSREGVDYAHRIGCRLMITVDCGIQAITAVDYANSLGIDVIICDHHLPAGALPAAWSILNPLLSECAYPYKHLSGCGVAFKLVQAFNQLMGWPEEAVAAGLDLVALSIACDLVPVDGENRVLLNRGLRRLNHSPRLGIWALLQQHKKLPPLKVSDLVFGTGPLLNAAGRMGSAQDAVSLLLAESKVHALTLAGQLQHKNRLRQRVDMAAFEAAVAMAMQQSDRGKRRSVVVYHPEWHPGVVGIVASRLAEYFYCPAVVLTRVNGRLRGSARTVRGFDLHAAMCRCSSLLLAYGGHVHAAGLQLEAENLEAFSILFDELVQEQFAAGDEQPLLWLSGAVRLSDLDAGFWQWIKSFEPFGPGNRSPIFAAYHVRDTGRSVVLENNHVRLHLTQNPAESGVRGIGFGLGLAFQRVRSYPFDIAFTLTEDRSREGAGFQLSVKGIRPAGSKG